MALFIAHACQEKKVTIGITGKKDWEESVPGKTLTNNDDNIVGGEWIAKTSSILSKSKHTFEVPYDAEKGMGVLAI